AVRIEDRRAADFHPDDGAVLPADADLVLIGNPLPSQRAFRQQHLAIFFRRREHRRFEADELFARVAGHLAEAIVDETHRALGVRLDESFAHPLDELAMPPFAVADRAIGALALDRADEKPRDALQR